MVDMSEYFKNIKEAFSTLSSGLKLTLRYLTEARVSRTPIGVENEHYFDQDKGIVTLQYPYESLPVPDNGRYRLHNEIDDCIVCDKCAKVCPVDCIDIEAIRAPETFGVTSDGTPKKIHAAKFDIDMSKCCFCGLCTTVCPTECLTMTKVYDFSEFAVENHVYSFADMTLVEIAEKRKELEAFEARKAEERAMAAVSTAANPAVKPAGASQKPAMRPKPQIKANNASDSKTENAQAVPKKKPMMRPKPVMKPTAEKGAENAVPKPKPVVKLKPIVKPESDDINSEGEKPKPKPVIKPKIQAKKEGDDVQPKPKFKPRPMIPKKKKDDGDK